MVTTDDEYWPLVLQAFYTECSWLIQQCETCIIKDLEYCDDMMELIDALVWSEYFHLDQVEQHVFKQIKKQSRQTLTQLNQSPIKDILEWTTKAQLIRLLSVVMK